MADPYSQVADELTRRIEALIPANPKILTITSAWDLLKIPGFDHRDLAPSAFQVAWALGEAKRRHAAK